jgi:hypothetical protein
VVVCCGL